MEHFIRAIEASELILGLQIGAFYSIVGLVVNDLITAALAGSSFNHLSSIRSIVWRS